MIKAAVSGNTAAFQDLQLIVYAEEMFQIILSIIQLIFKGIDLAVCRTIFLAGDRTPLKLIFQVVIPVVQIAVDRVDFPLERTVLRQLFIRSPGRCRAVYLVSYGGDGLCELFQRRYRLCILRDAVC